MTKRPRRANKRKTVKATIHHHKGTLVIKPAKKGQSWMDYLFGTTRSK